MEICHGAAMLFCVKHAVRRIKKNGPVIKHKMHCHWQKSVIEKVVNQPLKLRDPRPIP
jgi:hypothetical protein